MHASSDSLPIAEAQESPSEIGQRLRLLDAKAELPHGQKHDPLKDTDFVPCIGFALRESSSRDVWIEPPDPTWANVGSSSNTVIRLPDGRILESFAAPYPSLTAYNRQKHEAEKLIGDEAKAEM